MRCARVVAPRFLRPECRCVRWTVSALFGSLLLSILISAFLIAEPWLEDAGHRFVDRMVWHEPLDSWIL